VTKIETVFALEQAGWPSLMVDPTGGIRGANTAAKKLFGSTLDSHPNLAQAVWSRENEMTPAQFFASWPDRPDAAIELRFRGRDGSTCSYHTQVCLVSGEGEDLFLLQLFKAPPREAPDLTLEPPQASTVPPPPVPTPVKASEGAITGTVMDATVAQKQKLDCAMQLIRTVALDFNNALTSIMGHASWLLAKLESKNPLRGSLVEIEKSAQRAAEIAHDLAAFSRQEKDSRSQASGNMNDVLRRTVELFKETQPESLHWKLHFEPRPFSVQFDEAKMQQAFVKIMENAVQAMDNFGSVYVSSKNLELTESLKDGNVRLAPGAYISVEISDTGQGIPQANLSRIFEPFFTTKKDTGHRGLGLAWVYGIITNHGGSVAVTSEVNKGTSVRVFLPAQKKVVRDQLADSADLNGHQTILLIDDEDLLLTMGEMILSSFGYKVLVANNGIKALEIFAARANEIDLVITDLVMPQMSGRELIERLRRISPEIKIICASGFIRPPSNEDDENYLQKPFASQDLLRKVKQVLGVDSGKR
jgi:two-component system cell cycle sensor histidine kinase/response regulator CckA